MPKHTNDVKQNYSSCGWFEFRCYVVHGFVLYITAHLLVNSSVLDYDENWYFEYWNSQPHPPI